MATSVEVGTKAKPQWVLDAIAEGGRRRLERQSMTPEERRRRREEVEEALAERDRLPSIAPDSAEQYIREIRDEESEK